jgi:hypothetical protein
MSIEVGEPAPPVSVEASVRLSHWQPGQPTLRIAA